MAECAKPTDTSATPSDVELERLSLRSGRQLTVLSWNVKFMFRRSPGHLLKAAAVEDRLAKVAEIIRKADADLIVLQEAQLGAGRNEQIDILLELLRGEYACHVGHVHVSDDGEDGDLDHDTLEDATDDDAGPKELEHDPMFWPFLLYKKKVFRSPVNSAYIADGRGNYTERSVGHYEPFWWALKFCAGEGSAEPPAELDDRACDLFLFSAHFAPGIRGHDRYCRRKELETLLDRINTHRASLMGTKGMPPSKCLIVGYTANSAALDHEEQIVVKRVLRRFSFQALHCAPSRQPPPPGCSVATPALAPTENYRYYDNAFVRTDSLLRDISFELCDKCGYDDVAKHWTWPGTSGEFISDHYPVKVTFTVVAEPGS